MKLFCETTKYIFVLEIGEFLKFYVLNIFVKKNKQCKGAKMRQEIKKCFLCVILIFISIMVVEAILVLAILFFYSFLEFAFTAFVIGEDAKHLLFITYASCGIVAFFGINILCAMTLTNNYEKIKNKILERINE